MSFRCCFGDFCVAQIELQKFYSFHSISRDCTRKDLLLLPLSVECAAILALQGVHQNSVSCVLWNNNVSNPNQVASITSYVVFAGADGASAVMTSLISTGAVLLHLQVNGSFSVALLFEQLIIRNIQRIVNHIIQFLNSVDRFLNQFLIFASSFSIQSFKRLRLENI